MTESEEDRLVLMAAKCEIKRAWQKECVKGLLEVKRDPFVSRHTVVIHERLRLALIALMEQSIKEYDKDVQDMKLEDLNE